jgi:plasmid stabilization system protein ParE
MTDLPVVVSPHAETNIRRIHHWWSENRLAAPSLFLDELALSLSLLGSFPGLGKMYRSPGVPRLRRYLLRASRYHVYYFDSKTQVTVLTVWGAVRGATPNFRELLHEFKAAGLSTNDTTTP